MTRDKGGLPIARNFEDLMGLMNIPLERKEMVNTIVRLRDCLQERGRFIELTREAFHTIAKHTQPLATCNAPTCVEMRQKLLATMG